MLQRGHGPEPAAGWSAQQRLPAGRIRRLRPVFRDSEQPALSHAPDPARNLDAAVNGLRRRHPDLSAGEPVWRWQKCAFAAIAAVVIVAGFLAFSGTLLFVFAGLALPFSCVVALKFAALWHAATASSPAMPPPGADDFNWPRYSVLIPLFNEADVVPDLIAALGRIDYPRDRIEFLLILEQEDSTTRSAVLSSTLLSQMCIVIVPRGQPQTKPRALNYALAHATGDIVVVYDAEDLPEPDQLRRAAARLMSAPLVGCLQARLNIINDKENWLTRSFMAQTPQDGC